MACKDIRTLDVCGRILAAVVAHARAEFLDYLARSLAGCVFLLHVKRDRSHARMPSAAIALAYLRQVN
jgi:hypothetical protein